MTDEELRAGVLAQNILHLSEDGRHVELWSNGTRVHWRYIPWVGLRGAVEQCQVYSRQCFGGDASIGKDVTAAIA